MFETGNRGCPCSSLTICLSYHPPPTFLMIWFLIYRHPPFQEPCSGWPSPFATFLLCFAFHSYMQLDVVASNCTLHPSWSNIEKKQNNDSSENLLSKKEQTFSCFVLVLHSHCVDREKIAIEATDHFMGKLASVCSFT